MRRVAIVGVGNMGGAIAQRILDQRWPVQVFDIDPAKMAALKALGATPRDDAAQAAIGCGVLIVCVVDAAQTEEALFGAKGAAHVMRAGQSVLLCPTISPTDVEGFARRLGELGVSAIDAPMSGGPARARDGTMSLMVACDDAAFDAAQSLVRTLSGNFQLVARLPSVLAPWRNPLWVQFLSHKLLRLAVPWLLIVTLIGSAILPGPIYRITLVAQLLMYAIALAGLHPKIASRSRLASAAASFVVLNAAAWRGFWVWLLGRAEASWHKVSYAPRTDQAAAARSPDVGVATPHR